MKKKRLFLGLGMLTCAFVFASCDNTNTADTTNSTIPNTTVVTTSNDSNNTTTNNNNDNTNNNQIVEYDENGEPKTTFQAYELDLKRTNNASSASIDDSSFNVDTITNNSAITELSDEKSGLKRGTGKVVTKGEVNVTLVSGLNESAFIEYDEVLSFEDLYVNAAKALGCSVDYALNFLNATSASAVNMTLDHFLDQESY